MPYAANDAELQKDVWDESTDVGGGRFSFVSGFFHPFHGATTAPENIFIGGRCK
jgi:hypothetical protein